ncbi:hypothetical protein GQR58_027795 [Nymphon striatum]|nr:hypothetical protein GQR58_027795 [Nymphon striatum]
MEVSCKGEPCPPLHVTYPLHYSKKSRVGGLVLYFLKLVTSYQVLWEHTAASMKRTFISADSASQKINGKLYYGNFQLQAANFFFPYDFIKIKSSGANLTASNHVRFAPDDLIFVLEKKIRGGRQLN